jgi:hypothetical protein
MGNEEATIGNEVRVGYKAWMLLWVGIAVFGVLCVYAAVSN